MSPHFEPETSALVLIDYQVGTMQLIKNLMPDEALHRRSRADCGHFLPEECPDEVARQILAVAAKFRGGGQITLGEAKMTATASTSSRPASVIPRDDLSRKLSIINPDDPKLRHVAVVGDTYTILLSGAQTNGRYCLIDMSVPHCGGPGPHRHDFEEMFTLLEGEEGRVACAPVPDRAVAAMRRPQPETRGASSGTTSERGSA